MTPEAFVKALEGYYGQYPREAVKMMVGRYLKDYNQTQLDVLFKETLLNFSGQYKYPPDIAVLEGIRREIAGSRSWDLIGRYEEPQKLPDFTSRDSEVAPVVAGLLSGILKNMRARK